MVLIAGIAAGLLIQRRLKVTVTQRRLRSALRRIPYEWGIEGFDGLGLTSEVAAEMASLQLGVDDLGKQAACRDP